MNFLVGFKNFLQLINLHWMDIIVCVGLIVGIIERTKNYFSKSKDEQVKIAREQIKEVILKKITDAENTYADWNKAGQIKRSKVIEEIYKEYPILSKVVDQAELIAYIDECIDNSLVDLRKIIKENK